MGKKKTQPVYIFRVPKSKEGTKFLQLAAKFVNRSYFLDHKTHNSLTDIEVQIKTRRRYKGPFMNTQVAIYEGLVIDIIKILEIKLVNLIHELQKEFKTEGPDESAAVKQLMEKLLASYVAGIMKGKYDD